MKILKKVPIELFDEIKVYLTKKDFWRFLISLNEHFSELRYCARTISLNEKQSEEFLQSPAYANLILSKVKAPLKQLSVKIIVSSNTNFFLRQHQLITALSLPC
jgi:hypothetical protein